MEYAQPVIYTKNKIIDSEGAIPQYLYYVVSGFLRLFHHNENGEEITTHINCPIGFITSYSHFINQTTSDENLQCVTDCELLRLSKESLEIIYNRSEAFKDYSISVYQQSLSYHENRSRELATLTALQRYRNLLENYPAIL